MSYLQRIYEKMGLDSMTTADITVPLKPFKFKKKEAVKPAKSKQKKPKKPNKPEKAKKSEKPSMRTYTEKEAQAQKKSKVSFENLTNTRKLIPFIKEELNLTDPFYFENETWVRFTKKIAPKLLQALLLDMGIVPQNRKAEFIRYLDRRLRYLVK